MLILRVFCGLVFAGYSVAVIVAAATGGMRQVVIVGIAYICGMALLWLPLNWMSAIGSWRSSNALWRERMASGFYKTLPPMKDDDDD